MFQEQDCTTDLKFKLKALIVLFMHLSLHIRHNMRKRSKPDTLFLEISSGAQ